MMWVIASAPFWTLGTFLFAGGLGTLLYAIAPEPDCSLEGPIFQTAMFHGSLLLIASGGLFFTAAQIASS